MRKILLPLYTLSLCAVLYSTASFHHAAKIHRASAEPMAENIASKNYWEWLRLRDPATGEIPRGIHVREMAYARTLAVNSAGYAVATANSTIQTNGWQSAGPFNAGGRTQAIGIDVSNEANVLIATAQGGVWRSTDSGMSWQRSTAPDELKDIMSLVQDHRSGKTGTWYCGTGELLSTTDRRASVVDAPRWRTTDIGNGIYKSTDGGKKFFVLPSTQDQTSTTLDSAFDGVWNVVVDNSKTSQDIVYAAGFGAIMRSSDGGTTWTHVLGDAAHKSFCTDVQITSTGILYAYLSQASWDAATPSTTGVWRSTDGLRWTNITPANWPQATHRLKIAIAPSDETILYVAGSDDSAGLYPVCLKYTFLSGDGSGAGGTWEDRSRNLPVVDNQGSGGASTLGGYAVTLKVHPNDPNIVFFGGTNLLRSSDGFATANNIDWIGGYYWYWLNSYDSSQSYPNHHPDNHDIAFLPSNPHTMFSANDGGIYLTRDCLATNADAQYRPIEWEVRNTNDVASILYDVGVNHVNAGDSTILGGFQDQASWMSSGGGYWTEHDWGDGCYCAIQNDTAFYMSDQFGGVRRWLNESGMWYITGIQPNGTTDAQFVTPWMLDPANRNQMYFADNSTLWRNDDLLGIPDGAIFGTLSTNWSYLSQCMPSDGSLITALGMSVLPAHRLYYGTSSGHLYRVDGADGASPSPAEITGSIFPQNAFISCVAVDPENADKIVACFSNYHVISLFASDDGGQIWRNISGNLEQNLDGSGDGPSTRWVTVVHQGGQTLFLVGTSVGLFSATDISTSNVQWIPEGLATIGRITVENMDARQSDGFVAIATQGAGVFKTFVSAPPDPTQGVRSGVSIARSFSVSPNPAHGMVTVALSLDQTTKIRLIAVDPTGRIAEAIYDGTARSGATSYEFDATRLPSGTYYVELLTDEGVETRRLVVTK